MVGRSSNILTLSVKNSDRITKLKIAFDNFKQENKKKIVTEDLIVNNDLNVSGEADFKTLNVSGEATFKRNIISVTTILKDTDSGSIIIPKKKNNTFTLPELQNKGGMTFTLLIGNNNLTDIIIKCDNDIINGVIFYFNSSMVVIPKVIDNSKSIKINSKNVIGDKIELISDSTRWIVTGSVFREPNA